MCALHRIFLDGKQETPLQKRSSTARVVEGSHSFIDSVLNSRATARNNVGPKQMYLKQRLNDSNVEAAALYNDRPTDK